MPAPRGSGWGLYSRVVYLERLLYQLQAKRLPPRRGYTFVAVDEEQVRQEALKGRELMKDQA